MTATHRLFTFEVVITNGPITEKFSKKNKVISRTIQIRGKQTLEDLHYAIFDAFDRDDEHLYEFQIGGKGRRDRTALRYVQPMILEHPFGDEDRIAGDVTKTQIGSLDLKVKKTLWYWFDFGDDWWHQIDVVSIEDTIPKGKYPKVIQRVGESPPQYLDPDEYE